MEEKEMGRIVAIGGFGSGNGICLDKHAVEMTGKAHPNVLYLPTAGSDGVENIENATNKFGSLGCCVKPLCLITERYTEEELDSLFAWADMIYVGGGDTISMMKVWRTHGVDVRLEKIYRTDAAVLAGISAGAICWFACGHSDSESFHKKEGWHFCWAEGMLDLFHMAYCPHYDDEGRDSFDEMLREKDLVGLAMENDTAFVENKDRRYFIRCSPDANAYELKYENEVLKKTALEMVDLVD